MVLKKLKRKSDAELDAAIVLEGMKRRRNPNQASRMPTAMEQLVRFEGKRGPKSKYPWEAARIEYLTAAPAISLKQVGLRHNIPYDLVRRKAGQERWTALRNKEQLEILRDKRQSFQTAMAGEAISFDQTSIDVAKLGQGIIAGRLIEISKLLAASGDTSQAVIQKLQTGQSLSRTDLYSIVNYKELLALSQAAKMFQEIGRTALGTEVVDGSILNGEELSTDLEKVVSIGGELTKDDPQRLASFLMALEDAGLTALQLGDDDDAEDDTDAVRVIEGQLMQPGEGQKELTASITTMEESDAVGKSATTS